MLPRYDLVEVAALLVIGRAVTWPSVSPEGVVILVQFVVLVVLRPGVDGIELDQLVAGCRERWRGVEFFGGHLVPFC